LSAVVLFENECNLTWFHGEGHPCKSLGLDMTIDLLSLDLSDLTEASLGDEDIEVID
jgi:hypothetical protein